jgi:ubiquinone/menaquinone biosynthesis C-methylase UbiE
MSNELSSGEENTYFFDPESATEMARLINLARMFSTYMGGPLAEQTDPVQFQTILDLGCGPGSWVLDMAFDLPDSTVVGVDISRTMIDYANARARSQHLSNASFGVMDIRQPLDFADETFNLINARFLAIALYRDVWPRLIDECKRLLKPGGVLRLTEGDHFGLTTCPAFEKMKDLCMQLGYQMGYGFSPDGHSWGMTPVLPRLLRNAGFTEIKIRANAVNFSPFDEAYADIRDNTRVGMLQTRPIMIKTGMMTEEEFDKLYQQVEIEMLSDDFYGIWPLLTAWGTKSR